MYPLYNPSKIGSSAEVLKKFSMMCSQACSLADRESFLWRDDVLATLSSDEGDSLPFDESLAESRA